MKVHIAKSGRNFETEAGKPFFWLADTAWNTALRGDTADWKRFLETRQRQGFTVMQFVSTPWRGRRDPVHGPLFVESESDVSFPDSAWEKMEEWMSMIVEHGMVPAPIMIWDNNPDEPFFQFREETCIAVGRRMLERWTKYNPIWLLGGDGDYRSQAQIKKWKRLGREIFHDQPDAIVSMHPGGITWVGDIFADEPWYSFVGVQSGHGSARAHLEFLVNGPYSTRWQSIQKPFLNLEPNYEFATSYQDPNLKYDARLVRRATWWSLLGAPTAGLTYGSNPIWIWPTEPHGQAEGHGERWTAGHWTVGLETEGIFSLTVMRQILDRLPWTDFLPANHLLHFQPGWITTEETQKVAATPDLGTILAYIPVGGSLRFLGSLLERKYKVSWISPRTGEESAAEVNTEKGVFHVETPNREDWLLLLRT